VIVAGAAARRVSSVASGCFPASSVAMVTASGAETDETVSSVDKSMSDPWSCGICT
jgi:hypothetical protein